MSFEHFDEAPTKFTPHRRTRFCTPRSEPYLTEGKEAIAPGGKNYYLISSQQLLSSGTIFRTVFIVVIT